MSARRAQGGAGVAGLSGVKLPLAPLVAAAVVACGPREDVTPMIAVQPGAAARALALTGKLGADTPAKRTGRVQVALVDEAGRAVQIPDETEVALARPSGEDVASILAEDAVPTLDADVPPGEYVASFVSGGQRAASKKGGSAPVTVRAGETSTVSLVVTAPGLLTFTCLEPIGAMALLSRIPCDVSLDARDGSDPVTFASPDGRLAIGTAPGSYRVIASRGADYAPATFDIDVAPGRTTWPPVEGAVLLRRYVDTSGYLALDESLARSASAAIAREGVEAWRSPDDLFARITAKQPATALATSGPARTYVRLDDASPPRVWGADREADLESGLHDRRDVVLSNGPFLRVSANDAPIGGVARPVNGEVAVKVHVDCAPAALVQRVQVLRASGAAVPTQPVTLHPSPRGGGVGDAVFHLRATRDDAFVVVAEGDPPAAGADAPRAMTGALWVDADGDGVALGRVPPPPPEKNEKKKPKPQHAH